MNTTPTHHTYDGLDGAYRYYNRELFDGKLPDCLITLQRESKAGGFFADRRFGSRDGSKVTDEIALNPDCFEDWTLEFIHSVLVHEMAHLWQARFATPGRRGYHNKQWADKMDELGLPASATGLPGGSRTGEKMSHYIAEGGAFRKAFANLNAQGTPDYYIDRWAKAAAKQKDKAKKAASKTKFSCSPCGKSAAWAKPSSLLICGHCREYLTADAA